MVVFRVGLFIFARGLILREETLGLVGDEVAEHLKRVFRIDGFFLEELSDFRDPLPHILGLLRLFAQLTLVDGELV